MEGIVAQHDDAGIPDVERAALAVDEDARQDADAEDVGECPGAEVLIAWLGQP